MVLCLLNWFAISILVNDRLAEKSKIAMDDGYTKYTAGPGMLEFREAICNKLIKENEITIK